MDLRSLSKFVHFGLRKLRLERRRLARKKMGRYRLRLESLEDRTLLDAVHWIGGSGNWHDATHWDAGRVPGFADAAIINSSPALTVTIPSNDNIQVQSVTTGSDDTLSITGGSLTVTAGSSTLSGPLSMTDG